MKLMSMSPQARRSLTETFEGLALKPYRDSTGIVTAGYGHTSRSGAPVPRIGEDWTAQQADLTLELDLQAVEAEVAFEVRVALTQPQVDAVVDLVFNIGVGNFRSSSLLRFLNAKRFPEAANAFLTWDRAGGKVLPGLARRRAAERAWFLRTVLPPEAAARIEDSPQQTTEAHLLDHPDGVFWRLFNRVVLAFHHRSPA